MASLLAAAAAIAPVAGCSSAAESSDAFERAAEQAQAALTSATEIYNWLGAPAAAARMQAAFEAPDVQQG